MSCKTCKSSSSDSWPIFNPMAGTPMRPKESRTSPCSIHFSTAKEHTRTTGAKTNAVVRTLRFGHYTTSRRRTLHFPMAKELKRITDAKTNLVVRALRFAHYTTSPKQTLHSRIAQVSINPGSSKSLARARFVEWRR